MILTLILVVILVSLVMRLITAPFRYGPWFHRGYYGYNPYLYGCRRHHRFLGGFFPIIMLVALDRVFRRRF